MTTRSDARKTLGLEFLVKASMEPGFIPNYDTEAFALRRADVQFIEVDGGLLFKAGDLNKATRIIEACAKNQED